MTKKENFYCLICWRKIVYFGDLSFHSLFLYLTVAIHNYNTYCCSKCHWILKYLLMPSFQFCGCTAAHSDHLGHSLLEQHTQWLSHFQAGSWLPVLQAIPLYGGVCSCFQACTETDYWLSPSAPCYATADNDGIRSQPVLPLGPHVMVQGWGPLRGHFPCLSGSPTTDLFLGLNSVLLPLELVILSSWLWTSLFPACRYYCQWLKVLDLHTYWTDLFFWIYDENNTVWNLSTLRRLFMLAWNASLLWLFCGWAR